MTTVLHTPNGIAYGRLASLKGMLKLEKVGMKSRGGALRPRIAVELGLKPRDSHDKFIEVIQQRMEALLEAEKAAPHLYTDENGTPSLV